eukprot:2384517-Alexandrium_andersonii.AAC.1
MSYWRSGPLPVPIASAVHTAARASASAKISVGKWAAVLFAAQGAAAPRIPRCCLGSATAPRTPPTGASGARRKR